MAPPGPTGSEVALRATMEALRDELAEARRQLSTSTPPVTVTPVRPDEPTQGTGEPTQGTGEPTHAASTPGLSSSRSLDTRLLDWRTVDQRTQVGNLELRVFSLLLGQASYGSPYGATIAAPPGTKIILADLSLQNFFRPGQSPYEIHVDFFVIGDDTGLEYRGLPLPTGSTNALPDRFYLSSGQAFRGVAAFIVPDRLTRGRLYFTNFLADYEPAERLTVNLADVPMPNPTPEPR